MRIAFIGHDSYASLALTLLDAGHELTHLFAPGGTSAAVTVHIRDVERRSGVLVSHRILERHDLEAIHAAAPDFILCAGYPRRLPVRPGDPVPAVNMHPSPLPEGRGPRPIEWAILTGRASTAVTFHEITERFDAGPILWQESLPLSAHETTVSLKFRSRQLGEEMVRTLATNFGEYWSNRQPQGPGSYCRTPRREQRTLDLEGGVELIGRMLRAFAPGDTFVRVNGGLLVILDATSWPATHSHNPGTVVSRNGVARLIAVSDGYLYIRNSMSPSEARLRLWLRPLKRFLP